ncbi:uncharacterized protein LOC128235566 [Mya arenaria]|uniref:uncharacterized protein LOC128235566 n=1 Tax=Mya arenaria TaxID=6604 RepID=UPI0022E0E3F7|nr:uncharacterized protein LOC128235566 [Mya arenaria]
MDTPLCERSEALICNGNMTTPLGAFSGKKKKVSLKRVKNKSELNISKGKLRSVSKKQEFSFLNASVQKQTLRANNRALAQNLAKAREEIRLMKQTEKQLLALNQEQCVEINRLRRVAGIQDDQIELEVKGRIEQNMLQVKKVVEDLSQSMVQSSQFITVLYDKCVLYSRRSTDVGGSRMSSLGDGPQESTSDTSVTTSRVGPRREVFRSETTAPISDVPKAVTSHHTGSHDMSMIAEQSILVDEGEPMFTATPLESVLETTNDPISSKQTSKLPQRVPRSERVKTLDSKQKTKQDVKEIIDNHKLERSKESSTEEKDKTNDKPKVESNKQAKTKEFLNREEEKSNEKSKVQLGKDVKVVEKKNVERVNRMKEKKKKEKLCNISVVDAQPKEIEHDLGQEADVSAFGFGMNFSADLVSGSPIASEKQSNNPTTENEDQIKDSKGAAEKDRRRDTFVVPKAIVSKRDDRKKQEEGKNSVTNKSKILSSKKSSKELSKSEKTKVSKSAKQSGPLPEIVVQQNYNGIENPFKPTNVLLRSPPGAYISPYKQPDTVVEDKVDLNGFLATFKQSSEAARSQSPIFEPTFSDEPTRYFNTDMELTAVIDSSRLLEGFRSSKTSPNIPPDVSKDLAVRVKHSEQTVEKTGTENKKNENTEKVLENKHTDTLGNTVTKSKQKADKQESQKAARSKHSAKEQETLNQSDNSENSGAAVEVRTKKPGVFTFNVGRKEADGTRKPVPENTSRARSKKKIAVTPEKEERKTGDDRDMFNFGDRTPTVSLDQLPKPAAKNVYDLSMNESVVQSGTLKNMREGIISNGKSTFKIPEPKPDEHIYYLPLKGCPDEKPEKSKRSRSKSGTRSKSKTRKNDSEDEDWVPEKSSRARSASRSRGRSQRRKAEEKTEIAQQRRGRSQSRARKTDDDVEVSDVDDSNSVETVTRRGRSKSRAREVENDEEKKDEVETFSRRGRSKSRAREVENDEEKKDEVETVTRRGRSKSRAREVENDEEKKDEVETFSRRGRSKSRARAVKDNEEKIDEVETVSRHGRSKSCARQVEDNEEKKDKVETVSRREGSKSRAREVGDNEEKKDEVETVSRQGRSKSRAREVKNKEQPKDQVESVEQEKESISSRCRSRSRARKIVIDETDDDVDDEDDVIVVEGKRDAKTNVMSKSKAQKSTECNELENDSEKENDDDVKIERKSRGRSKHRKFTETCDAIEDKLSLNEKSHVDKDTKRRSRSRSVLVLNSEESSGEPEDCNKKALEGTFVVEDSDSECDSIPKRTVERKSSRKSGKEVKKTENENAIIAEEKDTGENYNSKQIEDDKFAALDKIVNRDRGRKSKRIKSLDPDDVFDDLEKMEEILAKDEEQQKSVSKENRKRRKSRKDVNYDYDDNESDSEITKPSTEVKRTKSVKKSVRKKKEKPDDKTNNDNMKAKGELVTDSEKRAVDEKKVTDEKQESLPEKTPAGPKITEKGKKTGGKSTRLGKSTSKRRVKEAQTDDQTPRIKKAKASPERDIKNEKDSIAMLKKRLTMLTSKTATLGEKAQAVVEEELPDEMDAENGDGGSRRRNRTQVSYRPLPLNTKLRQGDNLYVASSSTSKVKAEQTRLAIARKMLVPKVSKDDKENVDRLSSQLDNV